MLLAVATRRRLWIAVLILNAALAALIQAAAPAPPRLSDRENYDYNGRYPLTAKCPNSIYCYRVLIPMLLEYVPIEPERRWRGLQWLAHAATGSVVAIATAPIGSPYIASLLLQTSYAFTFTAYDPYTPDPVVFLIAAMVLYYWIEDRTFIVALVALLFVFAKETVALVVSVPAIAAMASRQRPSWWRWLAPAILAWAPLLFFHWYMDTYAGWGIDSNLAASFSTGSWLAIWLKNNPSMVGRILMVFAPFGFAWAFAVFGYRHSTVAIRQLAMASVAPILLLAFVQTPERALGNAFFVVVPMATAFLAQVPAAAAWAAAITSGLVTARMGLSTPWLPPSSVLLVPATLAAAWALDAYRRRTR